MMTNSSTAARKYSRRDGASAPKSPSSRNIGQRSRCTLIEKELAAARELVLDCGDGDHLPRSGARVCRTQPVVSQFRQADERGFLSGAACPLERQTFAAGEETDNLILHLNRGRRRPP